MTSWCRGSHAAPRIQIKTSKTWSLSMRDQSNVGNILWRCNPSFKMTRSQTDPMTAIDKQDTAERLKNRIFRHDPASIGNENRNRAAVLDAMDLAAQRSRGGTTDLPNTGGNEPTSSSAGPSAKPQALNIEAGKALSMFESLSWVYSLVEFFYGDCVPRHPKREKKTIYNP